MLRTKTERRLPNLVNKRRGYDPSNPPKETHTELNWGKFAFGNEHNAESHHGVWGTNSHLKVARQNNRSRTIVKPNKPGTDGKQKESTRTNDSTVYGAEHQTSRDAKTTQDAICNGKSWEWNDSWKGWSNCKKKTTFAQWFTLGHCGYNFRLHTELFLQVFSVEQNIYPTDQQKTEGSDFQRQNYIAGYPQTDPLQQLDNQRTTLSRSHSTAPD